MSREGVTNVYDGFGRLAATTLLMDGAARTLAHHYDPNGNRTRLIHPDGQAFDYLYDGVDRYAFSLANGTAWLYGQGFNAEGQVYAQSFGMHSAGWSSLFHDGVGRLSGLYYDLPGTGLDVGYGFAFNPASQLAGRTKMGVFMAAPVTPSRTRPSAAAHRPCGIPSRTLP